MDQSESNSSNSSNALKSGVYHLRSITGLRFIAAFVVFVSHVQHFMFPEIRQLTLGGPAVSFFFVLSGFILTYVYNNRLTWKGVPRFWFTRWARLWPLHVVCLAIAVWFMHAPIGSNLDGRNSWGSFIAQVFMVQSWIPIRYWFVDFNSVSWSISTELFFYLMFPLLLLLGNKNLFWVKLLGIFVVGFVLLKYFAWLFTTGNAPVWLDAAAVVIASPVVRLFEFAMGMATCLLMFRYKVPFVSGTSKSRLRYLIDSVWEILAVALVLVIWMAIHRTKLVNFLFTAPEVGFTIGVWVRVSGGLLTYAFLIFIFASRRGILGQIMGTRLAVWMGEISFAFYLIHQIVIVRLNFMALDDLQFAFYSFSIALLHSALLYQIVEMPCRSALVSVYDRKPGWLGKGISGLRTVLSTKTGLIQVTALLLIFGSLWMHPVETVKRTICQSIQDASPAELRNVVFYEEAILMGMQAHRVERGIHLKMAWIPKRSCSRRRFIHICDSKGNILRQGPMESDAFEIAPPNQPLLDQVLLTKRKIKGADYIAIGFWSEKDECAIVQSPKAEMGGFRIKLFDLKDIKPKPVTR